jgi:hypothetical protein
VQFYGVISQFSFRVAGRILTIIFAFSVQSQASAEGQCRPIDQVNAGIVMVRSGNVRLIQGAIHNPYNVKTITAPRGFALVDIKKTEDGWLFTAKVDGDRYWAEVKRDRLFELKLLDFVNGRQIEPESCAKDASALHAEKLFQRAFQAASSNNYEAAEALYELGLRHDTDNSLAYFHYANVLRRNNKDDSMAFEHFFTAYHLSPNSDHGVSALASIIQNLGCTAADIVKLGAVWKRWRDTTWTSGGRLLSSKGGCVSDHPTD